MSKASLESTADHAPKGRFLFVANVDWFFISHRLPLAVAARDLGYEVWVAAIDTGRLAEIATAGFHVVALPTTRRGTGPIEQFRLIAFLIRLYRRLRPTIIHQIAVKPVVYGSLAARFLPHTPVVNSIAGFGYTGGSGLGPRLVRLPLRALYFMALRRRHSITIFQNPEDLREFVDAKLVRPTQVRLVRGSGVDCRRFAPSPEPEGPPVVTFAARMLWEKGVGIFVEAARILTTDDRVVRFVLVGAPDDENPTSVPVSQLEAWEREGVVEWWRQRTDMPEVLAASHVVVLPTFYREGLPKILIEAAAAGRPAVATDIPGCREAVQDGVNGILIPTRDAAATAEAVTTLVADRDLRLRMGAAARELALRNFTLEATVDQIVGIYTELLDGTEDSTS